jgi:hypothetical protein
MTRAFIAWTMIPVILAELSFAPFWSHRYLDAYSGVATTQTDLTGVFIPIYLAAIGIGLLLLKRSLPPPLLTRTPPSRFPFTANTTTKPKGKLE